MIPSLVSVSYNVLFLLSIGITQITKEPKYANVPMSFADACLVRMTELYPNSAVLTLDSDFRIYRKNKNQVIPVIIPDSH